MDKTKEKNEIRIKCSKELKEKVERNARYVGESVNEYVIRILEYATHFGAVRQW